MVIPKKSTHFQQFLAVLRTMGTLKEHLRLPISQKWEGEAGKEGDDVTQPFFENEAVFFFFCRKPIRCTNVSCFHHL